MGPNTVIMYYFLPHLGVCVCVMKSFRFCVVFPVVWVRFSNEQGLAFSLGLQCEKRIIPIESTDFWPPANWRCHSAQRQVKGSKSISMIHDSSSVFGQWNPHCHRAKHSQSRNTVAKRATSITTTAYLSVVGLPHFHSFWLVRRRWAQMGLDKIDSKSKISMVSVQQVASSTWWHQIEGTR